MIGFRTRMDARQLIVLLLAGLVAGCGRGSGNVSGTVTFNGVPLTTGTITFYDPDQRASSGAIKPDGSYTVTQVRTGTAKIAVTVPLAIAMPGVAPLSAKIPSLPARYLDPDLSGLTRDVVSGDQVHPIELQP